MSLAVETHDLAKTYGTLGAVQDLNLQIKEGEVYGLLGPNGAGKTTTILMLLGLTESTAGWAQVFGYDCTRQPLRVKRLAGYLPEKLGFYENLSARDNLLFTAQLNGLKYEEAARRVAEFLALVGLSGEAGKAVGKFSRGMKQRLGIADVLVKSPRLVFLDEPTAGIDPQGAGELLDFIRGMARDQGITVVLSSHQLPHVQAVCGRVGIMAKGRLVTEGEVAALRTPGRFRVEVRAQGPAQLQNTLRRLKGVVGVTRQDDLFLVDCDRDCRPEIARAVMENQGQLQEMKFEELSLEEVYRRYLKEAA